MVFRVQKETEVSDESEDNELPLTSFRRGRLGRRRRLGAGPVLGLCRCLTCAVGAIVVADISIAVRVETDTEVEPEEEGDDFEREEGGDPKAGIDEGGDLARRAGGSEQLDPILLSDEGGGIELFCRLTAISLLPLPVLVAFAPLRSLRAAAFVPPLVVFQSVGTGFSDDLVCLAVFDAFVCLFLVADLSLGRGPEVFFPASCPCASLTASLPVLTSGASFS